MVAVTGELPVTERLPTAYSCGTVVARVAQRQRATGVEGRCAELTVTLPETPLVIGAARVDRPLNVSVTGVAVVLLMVIVPSTRRNSVHVTSTGPVRVRLPVTYSFRNLKVRASRGAARQ